MEKNENADSSFVRGFFNLCSWLATMLPPLYALYLHQWTWMVLILISEVGAVVGYAIKKLD